MQTLRDLVTYVLQRIDLPLQRRKLCLRSPALVLRIGCSCCHARLLKLLAQCGDLGCLRRRVRAFQQEIALSGDLTKVVLQCVDLLHQLDDMLRRRLRRRCWKAAAAPACVLELLLERGDSGGEGAILLKKRCALYGFVRLLAKPLDLQRRKQRIEFTAQERVWTS